ncbi:MAG TPA: hypothetical protein VNN18_00780 [Candidatus Xenobia bacterium]|nr:hypothetical protein [Candidatus Xenobia bacterium]
MRRPQAGYALLVMLFLAAMVLIALAAAAPRLLSEGQREKEEELIFRGEQYKHAIGLYYKKFGRYPMKMEDLLRTNDRGYLRRQFRDPMTKDGKWRFIGVGAGGVLIGGGRSPIPGGAPPPATGTGLSNAEPKPPSVGTGEPGSLPIAGVASRSTASSIRIYNGAGNYADWEFIYDPAKDPALVQGIGGAPRVPGQPGKPGQPAQAPGTPPRM